MAISSGLPIFQLSFYDEAKERHDTLLEEISMFSEEMMEALLAGGEVDTELIYAAVRKGTLALEFTPVFMGSAYKNKGVQAAA
jgi:elongation factor G